MGLFNGAKRPAAIEEPAVEPPRSERSPLSEGAENAAWRLAMELLGELRAATKRRRELDEAVNEAVRRASMGGGTDDERLAAANIAVARFSVERDELKERERDLSARLEAAKETARALKRHRAVAEIRERLPEIEAAAVEAWEAWEKAIEAVARFEKLFEPAQLANRGTIEAGSGRGHPRVNYSPLSFALYLRLQDRWRGLIPTVLQIPGTMRRTLPEALAWVVKEWRSSWPKGKAPAPIADGDPRPILVRLRVPMKFVTLPGKPEFPAGGIVELPAETAFKLIEEEYADLPAVLDEPEEREARS